MILGTLSRKNEPGLTIRYEEPRGEPSPQHPVHSKRLGERRVTAGASARADTLAMAAIKPPLIVCDSDAC